MKSDEETLTFFLELRERRIAGITQDIQAWADRPIEFSRDPYGTHLYSIEETKRAYCRRFIDLSKSARTLLEEDKSIAASILSRSAIETVAMSVFFVHEVSRLMHAKNKENLEAKVERFVVGSSAEGVKCKPIHVLDALRHLQELDEVYINHLWNRHPTLHELVSGVLTPGATDKRVEDVIATVSVMKNYDFLSDFAHPNGPGTFFMYGQPENEDAAQSLVHERLASLTKSATWQGHHMLKALEESVGQADEYFRLFDSAEG